MIIRAERRAFPFTIGPVFARHVSADPFLNELLELPEARLWLVACISCLLFRVSSFCFGFRFWDE